MQNLNKIRCKFYICGDFNINHLSYYTSNNVKCFTDSITSLGCENVIKKNLIELQPTVQHLLTTYTHNTQNHITTGILVDDISDHLPKFIVIEMKKIKEPEKYSKKKYEQH